MSSSTSASDFPGCAATSARRYSSASYSASWISEGSSPSRAVRSCLRYSSIERGAAKRFIQAPGESGTRRGSWRRSFDEAIDEVTRLLPDAAPLLEYGPAFVGDAVV